MTLDLIFGNHPFGGCFVEDHLLLVRLLAEAAGHRARYAHDLSAPDRTYVLVESFEPRHVEAMRRYRDQGAGFVFVVTEYVTGDTFNDLIGHQDSEHYSRRPYWRDRFAAFAAAAELARAVWVAVSFPDQMAAYRAVVPARIPVLPLPMPHCPHFPRLTPDPDREYDAFFSGTETAHRAAVLGALAPLRVMNSTYLPDAMRRALLARTKTVLNLRQGPDWRYPSPLRYWYHLNHGQLVVGETCAAASGLDGYVPTVPTEHLPGLVAHLAGTGEWEPAAAELGRRFAAEHPCEPAARELFARTFPAG